MLFFFFDLVLVCIGRSPSPDFVPMLELFPFAPKNMLVVDGVYSFGCKSLVDVELLSLFGVLLFKKFAGDPGLLGVSTRNGLGLGPGDGEGLK